MDYQTLKNQDKEVFEAIINEESRQKNGLELIPSENYTSRAVREAVFSLFTNKYAEGYPGKRYYGGQEFTDAIENLAIDRAKQLFNCDFANVQSHAGAQANLAVYSAVLNPGDTVLGMELSHGGHLTHGHPVTLPAKIYKFARYGMKNIETGEIDYEKLRQIAIAEKPKLIIAGFSSYPRELNYQKFSDIAKEVGALTLADISHLSGLIAGGVLKNPFDYGFDLISTTTHKTLRGPRGGMILTRINEELAKKIDKAVFPGTQGGPLMHQIAGKAVAFGEAQMPEFKEYAEQVLKNAKKMAQVFLENKATLITGGTDNHLILCDTVKSFGLSGKEAQNRLDKIGITLNMNVIPDDPRGAMDPSGIRFGTPAITTRGFKESDCADLAQTMIDVLKGEELEIAKIKVQELVKKYPLSV